MSVELDEIGILCFQPLLRGSRVLEASGFAGGDSLIIYMERKFIRFLMVGGINALFGYLMFILFLYLRFHYTIAVLLATVFGILFNFKTTGKLVFGNSDNMLIFKFFGIYTITYIINTGALKVFSIYKVDLYIAGALMLLPMAVVSFLLNKKIVFRG